MFCAVFILFLPLFSMAQDAAVAGDWKTMIPGQDGTTMIPLKVKIAEDGTYTLDFGGDGVVDVKGTYKTDGNQIIVKDVVEEGKEGCDGKGVYNFSVNNDTLVMERVSDECPGRGGEDGRMEMKRDK